VRPFLFPNKSISTIAKPMSHVDLGQAALAALSRAGLRAAEDARRTNTYMVVEEDGKVLRESPEEYLRKRGEPTSPSGAKRHA
jgi:hypothetical protein